MIVAGPPNKDRLRDSARARRAEADRVAPQKTARTFEEKFSASVLVDPGVIVAGYVKTQSEADPSLILETLRARGHVIALPVVEVGKREPLTFRTFDPNKKLVSGPFGIPVPALSEAAVEPDLIIVPLVAFDRAGHRLGYGAGYYDRTIEALRKTKAVLTVGLAYAVQEVDRVPAEDHDQRLDWIVTEKEAIRVRR